MRENTIREYLNYYRKRYVEINGRCRPRYELFMNSKTFKELLSEKDATQNSLSIFKWEKTNCRMTIQKRLASRKWKL